MRDYFLTHHKNICSEKIFKTRVTFKSDFTRIISPPYPNHSLESANQQLKEK